VVTRRDEREEGWGRKGNVISNIIERVPESDALYGDFDEADQPWKKTEKEKGKRKGGVSCNLAV